MITRKTTETTRRENEVGRKQTRLERLQIIKEAAERHYMKSLWYKEKHLFLSGR
jgi:hypothetical protein